MSLSKKYIVKNTKLIELLFVHSEKVYGRFLYLGYVENRVPKMGLNQFLFVVPKRSFSRAVDRNRLKRLLKEVVRKHLEDVIKVSFKPLIILVYYKSREVRGLADIEEDFLATLCKMKVV